MHPQVAKTRSAVGVAVRRGDPHAISEARRNLAAAKIEDYVQRTVAAAPPLTPEQRDRLALLLQGGQVAELSTAQARRKAKAVAANAAAELTEAGGDDAA